MLVKKLKEIVAKLKEDTEIDIKDTNDYIREKIPEIKPFNTDTFSASEDKLVNVLFMKKLYELKEAMGKGENPEPI